MQATKSITAVALLALTASAWASDEEQLTRNLNDFLWGASIGSPGAHERFWSEDLVYTSSSGTRTNKDEIMAGMRGQPEPAADTEPAVVYTAEDIDIRVYGDTAIVAFRLLGTVPGDPPEVDQYFNTGTFLRKNGEWKAVAWQATRIPPSTSAGAE